MRLKVNFTELQARLPCRFNEFVLVEKTDIPKEYGLITYTQDKIITIT